MKSRAKSKSKPKSKSKRRVGRRASTATWRDAASSFGLEEHNLRQIDAYEKDVSAFIDGHTHMAVSYVGMKTPSGLVPVLVAVQPVSLDGQSPVEVKEETRSLIAGLAFRTIGDGAGHSFIAKVIRERGIDTPFGPLRMERQQSERNGVYYQSFAADFERKLGSNAYATLDITGESFTAGRLLWLDSAEAGLELRANARPFHDVNDVFDAVHLRPARRERGQAGIRIICGAPLTLVPGFALSAGRLKGKVQLSANVQASDVSLRARAVSLDQGVRIERETWPVEEAAHPGDGRYQVTEIERTLVPCNFLNLYLAYRQRIVHQFFVADPARSANPLAITYRHGDPELSRLTKWLNGEGKDRGPDFERAVALLAGLRGFATMHFGSGDSVDVCATTPRGNMLLIECTTGRPNDNDRVGGLVLRHRLARAALDNSNLSWAKILPVMATSLPRDSIQEEVTEALTKRVVVLTHEDLMAQLQLVDAIPNADDLFAELESSLPDQFLAKLGR